MRIDPDFVYPSVAEELGVGVAMVEVKHALVHALGERLGRTLHADAE